MAGVNALVLASLASAPQEPEDVGIGGIMEASTTLKWQMSKDINVMGYKVYWRDTTSHVWQHSKFVGLVSEYVLKDIVIDNYLFGVASVGENGAESLIQFPRRIIKN